LAVASKTLNPICALANAESIKIVLLADFASCLFIEQELSKRMKSRNRMEDVSCKRLYFLRKKKSGGRREKQK
jgi:hypothetical protein